MDTVLGFSFGSDSTNYGDGGCAIVADGKPIIAISEERLSRKKYDGNFLSSLTYCLDNTGLCVSDIDAFVCSPSSEFPIRYSDISQIMASKGIFIPKDKLLINHSHDLTHACGSFFSSPFKRALVAVIDYNRELLNGASLYIGEGEELIPLEMSDIPSIGTVYEYITKLLGYNSYQEAGKTMALAGYGGGELSGVHLLERLANIPENERFSFLKQEIEEKLQRDLTLNRTGTPSREQIELAWLIQKETEELLVSFIEENMKKHKLAKLCLAGGVGLNCVANLKLVERYGFDNLFIQPASGDSGLCLGSAYYGYYLLRKNRRFLEEKTSSEDDNVYLGKSYSDEEINNTICRYMAYLKIVPNDGIEAKVSKLLQDGFVVGWFQGKSEFGPRALGNRSIIASPSSKRAKERLDSIKSREYYRPYAPSVLEDKVSDFFVVEEGIRSPFMLIAVKARKEKIFLMENVVHVDGTSRIQTVNKAQNPRYYKLISNFYKSTNVPLVLNTSFNRAGEPMVESPEDAIKCFLATDIDYLALGDMLLAKA